jgi:ABC-2 type transport system permease protein
VNGLPSTPGWRDDVERIRLVAEREFVEYARQPSYRNGTIITSLLILAGIVAASVVPRFFGGPEELRLGVVPTAEVVAETVLLQADPEQLEVTVTSFPDRAAAVAAVRDEVIDAAAVGNDTIVVLEELGPAAGAALQAASDVAGLAGELGVAPVEALATLRTPLQLEVLHPPDPGDTPRRVATLVGVLLALGQVMGGAFVIASGLVEEKATRVVEVLVAKIHPRHLLVGKLVGLYAVLTLQLVVFVAVGLAGLALSPDLDVLEGLLPATGAILAFYTLGFVIFGALFSIAGAMSARQEDMALKMQPMMFLVLAAFGAAFWASGTPDGLISQIATYVPITAPAVIPARQVAGVVAWWEVLLAVTITLATALGALRIAGRAYTGGALRTRGTTTLRALLRDGR